MRLFGSFLKIKQIFPSILVICVWLTFAMNAYGGVLIPSESDWTDRGVVLEQSSSGFDRYFAGYSPSAVVKKDGTFFLYYIGSPGPRTTDGKPRDRALCVATSTDGIHFIRYSGNPVLTHQPHDNQEEGIFSVAATLDDAGNIVLYYGAIWAANNTTESVDININVATSNDGLNFTDLGTVIKSNENDGENTPFGIIYAQGGTSSATGNWHVWYGRSRVDSLATGDTFTDITRSGSIPISISSLWKGMDAVLLNNDTVAIFADEPLKVWTSDINSLDQYQTTNISYSGLGGKQQGLALFMDMETSTWYLYFRSAGSNNLLSDVDKISLWTAPITQTGPDVFPPEIASVTTSGSGESVFVKFTEPIEVTSATTLSNYSINNDLTIFEANLESDLLTVTLRTSQHTEGVTYTSTVSRVQDLASTPNVIAANTQMTYTFAGQLVISSLTVDSGKAYEVVEDGLQSGSLVYIDRIITFKDVPASLLGATYIKTANDDKGLTGASFITFEVNQDVTVYVAHDNRIATKPSWMESFTDTGDDLVTTDTTLSIFAKHVSAGTVTLGGNEGDGYSMYIAIIVAQGNPLPSAPTGLKIGSLE